MKIRSFLSTRLLGCTILLFVPIASFSAGLSPARDGGRVSVHVEESFPGIQPDEAMDAWLSYQWERGGGLFGVVVFQENKETRRLAPIWMEETLLQNDDDDDDETNEQACSLRYKVTDMGLLAFDIEESSHSADVHFVFDENKLSTTMIWDVSFEAINRRSLWQGITEGNIAAASKNLASYLSTPCLYRRSTKLRHATSAADAMDEWVQFVWKEGGGLPLPPAIQLNEKDRMVVPPFLIERLVSKDTEKNEIRYTVVNPGQFTYQVHTHAERVTFIESQAGEVEMVWEVEIRPWRGYESTMKLLTSVIVSTIARNFKAHIAEPGATIALAPPRGKGEAFGQVSKNSWLGGVLAAHLADKRSTMEQSIAMFQPWTWGRCTDDPGEEEEWTTGFLSD